MKIFLMSIISLAFMALSTSAMAATTAAAPINVSATGVISCTAESADIAFGNYDGTIDLVPSSVTLGAQCNSGGVSVTFSLDTGNHYDAVGATRRLANGTNYLNYELYVNGGSSTIFGNGTHGITRSGITHAIFHYIGTLVYGKLLAGQAMVGGTYSDTVNLTVTY